jgi:hypothetical protein
VARRSEQGPRPRRLTIPRSAARERAAPTGVARSGAVVAAASGQELTRRTPREPPVRIDAAPVAPGRPQHGAHRGVGGDVGAVGPQRAPTPAVEAQGRLVRPDQRVAEAGCRAVGPGVPHGPAPVDVRRDAGVVRPQAEIDVLVEQEVPSSNPPTRSNDARSTSSAAPLTNPRPSGSAPRRRSQLRATSSRIRYDVPAWAPGVPTRPSGGRRSLRSAAVRRPCTASRRSRRPG